MEVTTIVANSNCRGVRAATAQGCNVSVIAHALKARDRHNFALVEIPVDAVRVNGVDACPCVHLVGMDGHLIAQKRHGVIAGVFHGHGKEGDADLLAGGDEHIQFPGVGDVLHLPGQPDKPVRFAGHGEIGRAHV